MASEINLFLVLPGALLILIIWVGIYVFMFLTVMRVDPQEKKFREESGLKDTLLPSKK